jgi:hypothetical protein
MFVSDWGDHKNSPPRGIGTVLDVCAAPLDGVSFEESRCGIYQKNIYENGNDNLVFADGKI